MEGPNPVRIEVSAAARKEVGEYAYKFFSHCRTRGSSHTNARPNDVMIGKNQIGLLGEWVVASWYDLTWNIDKPKDERNEPDVGHYDVRTSLKHTNRLWAEPKEEKPDRVVIFLTTEDGGQTFFIRGWSTVDEVKACPAQDINGSILHLLPYHRLKSVELLPEWDGRWEGRLGTASERMEHAQRNESPPIVREVSEAGGQQGDGGEEGAGGDWPKFGHW